MKIINLKKFAESKRQKKNPKLILLFSRINGVYKNYEQKKSIEGRKHAPLLCMYGM